MLLTNYDLYDIYWTIVLMRAKYSEYDYAVTKVIKDVIDAEQTNNVVCSNIIRSVLSDVKGLKEREEWQWISTQNIYTHGIKVIKDNFPYQILSAMFEELLTCLTGSDEEQIFDLKDAMHNIPIILAEESKNKNIQKHVAREITFYRKKWNKYFLTKMIK